MRLLPSAGPKKVKAMRPKATTMTLAIDHFMICLALILALTAAIVTTRNGPGIASRFGELLRMGTLPEARMLAGAIGEHPESLTGP
jgi:hypothetical protein